MLARDTVRQGETVMHLAQRLLGNPFEWRTIVALNHLKPPYITAQPHANCLSVGDTVLYPAQQGQTPSVDISALVVNTYKRDLATHNRDLVLQDGRLLTQAGVANLKDAVMRRIRNLVGRHPFWPEYGSLALTHVGRPADDLRLRFLCLDTERAVISDPRVVSCQVVCEWQNEVLTAVVTVQPIAPGDPFIIRQPLR